MLTSIQTLTTPPSDSSGPQDSQPQSSSLRLALLPDFPEENWRCMDYAAEMLLTQLNQHVEFGVQAISIKPGFYPWLQWISPPVSPSFRFASERLINCFANYPFYLKKRVQDYDCFHVCDHSYAQLVHTLPPAQTGVFCHDINAFQVLLDPDHHPGSWRFKLQQTIVLKGLQKAAVVFYTTQDVRRDIERYQVVDPARLVQAPLGIAPEFTPHAPLHPYWKADAPFLLSVSSSRQRKRLDVLLAVFAALRSQFPDLRLVRVGRTADDWSTHHRELIHRYQLGSSITVLHDLSRLELADVYRQAAAVLVTSEMEGFGLPVIEALACGPVVIASDLPVLREVGGEAVVYCPVGHVDSWTEVTARLLQDPIQAPALATRLQQASLYSWQAHAQTIAQAYHRLMA